MDEFLDLALKGGAEYVEAHRISTKKHSVNVSNGIVEEIASGQNQGIGVRVLVNGMWGTAYSNKECVKEIVENALKNAKLCRHPTPIGELKSIKKEFKTKVKKNPSDRSFEEKRDLLLSVEPVGDEISNLSLSYTDIKKKVEFLNSEGRNLSWDDTICQVMCSSFARKGDRFDSHYDLHAEHGGYEIAEELPLLSKKVMETNIDLLGAKPAKGGKFPVIVDQKLGGVFAHEALGHACEADLILTQNSILKDKLGKKIGRAGLEIYDDGSLSGTWGWTPFDSEGVLGSKTGLIDNGILSGFLHSRATAYALETDPTGNGRAQSVGTRIIPRMTNTCIGNGDSSFEEQISEIKEGYYLINSAGGQVDPATGEFLFNAGESFSIKNGEIRKRVKGASLMGNILTTLHNIRLRASDLNLKGGGACGKAGQYVLTCEGSPHMLIEDVKVGGINQ